MFHQTKVSILVPLYNASAFLERCVRSLFEQTYENLEFVFVNDGSTDNSIQLLHEFCEQYPNRTNSCVIIDRTTNKGISFTRNELLQHATGDFISFVDADDYIEKNAIELLVENQKKYDSDIESCGFIIEYNNGNKKTILKNLNKESFLDEMVTGASGHELYCRLFRRDVIKANHLTFSTNFNIAEDWLFLIKCAYYSKTIHNSQLCLYHYNCMNQASLMRAQVDWDKFKERENVKFYQETYHFLSSRQIEARNHFLLRTMEHQFIVLNEAIRHRDKDYHNYILGTNQDFPFPARNPKWSILKNLKWRILQNYRLSCAIIAPTNC